VSHRVARGSTGPGAGARAARAAAFSLGLLVAVATSGCGLKFWGSHPADVTTRPAKAKAHTAKAEKAPKATDHGEPDNLAEARTRVASFPDDPYWHFRLGQFYAAADSNAEAEAAYRSALARDAQYAPAMAALSKLYYQTGRHEEAVRMLEPVRSNPATFTEDSRAALLAGMALHLDALGRPDLAEATVPRSEGDLKHTGPAMVYVGLRGDRPDSVADLARATLREDSHSAVNLNNYGITRLRAADPKAARKAFHDAIERDPSLPGPYYNLAILEKFYFVDDEAAAGWFRDYWKRSHDDPDSLRAVFESKPVAQKGEGR